MPIYAFRCAACGHAFDRLQKLADPDPDACPACGAAAVQRQLTAPSFRLAGSGWYETDFKKEGEKKRNLVEGGEGAAKSAETAKSDAAPAGGAKPDAAAKPAPDAAPAKAKPAEKPAAAS
ncbi:zinc ribbon domain-containing protein [Luteimonas sp. SJ-92]|uniref:Zinc ribbon domain-containing protein n=1 Tax=Luteimonas salinisoli TaxID=2752307 RepID=A0A853JJ59_9GAMM|nr:zinc ribbon domain-containing protein [Luteimonas salinisoli]NZA28609.1 zinc ribbon domain-containing protein [Luteimonas salinisoli]